MLSTLEVTSKCLSLQRVNDTTRAAYRHEVDEFLQFAQTDACGRARSELSIIAWLILVTTFILSHHCVDSGRLS